MSETPCISLGFASINDKRIAMYLSRQERAISVQTNMMWDFEFIR